MSVPVGVCLNCGQSKEFLYSREAKRAGYYCATVDYWGETASEFDRHRFSDWPKRWLRKLGIKEESLAKYARVESLSEWAIDCEDLGTGHLIWRSDEQEHDFPEGTCVRCGRVPSDPLAAGIAANA